MKKLNENITIEEINAIITSENKKADNEKDYEPANNLTLLTGEELRILSSIVEADSFREKYHQEILRLELEILDLYSQNDLEYLESFECRFDKEMFLKYIFDENISFEQILEKAEEVMNEFEHGVYTIKAIYEQIVYVLNENN